MVSRSKFSILAASQVTGKSRTTITQHIKTGKLSTETNINGKKVIDAAELMRVYGELRYVDGEEGSRHKVRTASVVEPSIPPDVKHLQEQLNREVVERARERQQYREQVEQLQEALMRAQEGHNRATLLLENQSQGAGEWKQAFQAIEERLAKQEEKTQQQLETANQKITRYKKALEAEQQKTFWQWLRSK